MQTDSYPLHPDQAQPYYCTIPLEEYEKEAQIRKMAMEAMGDAMADKRRRS